MFVLKSKADRIGEELTQKRLEIEQLTEAYLTLFSTAMRAEQSAMNMDAAKAAIQQELEQNKNEETRASLKRILNIINAKA